MIVGQVYVSKHAVCRMRERLGLNKKAIAREVERVMARGLTHREVTGRLKERALYLLGRTPGEGIVRLTPAGAFIFRGDAGGEAEGFDEVLVTVIPHDGEMSRLVRRQWKQG